MSSSLDEEIVVLDEPLATLVVGQGAAAYLLQQGHDVVNLDGGMLDWEGAGRPMVSETGRTPQVV